MPGRRQQRQREETAVARQLIHARYQLYMRLALAVPIASLFIPLFAVVLVARAFAGKETTLTVSIVVSVVFTLTIGAGAGLIAFWRRSQQQAKELQRLRERCTRLEGERDALRRTVRQLTPGSGA